MDLGSFSLANVALAFLPDDASVAQDETGSEITSVPGRSESEQRVDIVLTREPVIQVRRRFVAELVTAKSAEAKG
jgi:hypothetical protein